MEAHVRVGSVEGALAAMATEKRKTGVTEHEKIRAENKKEIRKQ